MGMDIYGKKPTTPEGEYFSNNVWWWRPLAKYIIATAPVIAAHCRYWQSNDGDGLNAPQSLALAKVLEQEIAAGHTATYAAEYTAAVEAIPRETCNWCGGTGVRRDSVGVEHGQTERIINDEGHPRKGQKGWCNGCDGRGDMESSAANYPFSVDNVAEFCVFLRSCGGFEIN